MAALAARVSRTVIEAETARAYRGDKKAAYQALSGIYRDVHAVSAGAERRRNGR